MKPAQLVITIRDGMVEAVFTDGTPVEYRILDGDTQGIPPDSDQVVSFRGDQYFLAYTTDADADPVLVAEVFAIK